MSDFLLDLILYSLSLYWVGLGPPIFVKVEVAANFELPNRHFATGRVWVMGSSKQVTFSINSSCQVSEICASKRSRLPPVLGKVVLQALWDCFNTVSATFDFSCCHIFWTLPMFDDFYCSGRFWTTTESSTFPTWCSSAVSAVASWYPACKSPRRCRPHTMLQSASPVS